LQTAAEVEVVVGTLDPRSTPRPSVGVCALRVDDYSESSVWRDWCWFTVFICGACVSCSSILCSIHSQYILQDGEFIFIEISWMTRTSAMHERTKAKTGLRVTWGRRRWMCHAPTGAWLVSHPSALVYDERCRHCFMMDDTAKNAFVAAGNVSLINLEMNDTPVIYIVDSLQPCEIANQSICRLGAKLTGTV
jgi:hypothetical protein